MRSSSRTHLRSMLVALSLVHSHRAEIIFKSKRARVFGVADAISSSIAGAQVALQYHQLLVTFASLVNLTLGSYACFSLAVTTSL